MPEARAAPGARYAAATRTPGAEVAEDGPERWRWRGPQGPGNAKRCGSAPQWGSVPRRLRQEGGLDMGFGEQPHLKGHHRAVDGAGPRESAVPGSILAQRRQRAAGGSYPERHGERPIVEARLHARDPLILHLELVPVLKAWDLPLLRAARRARSLPPHRL